MHHSHSHPHTGTLSLHVCYDATTGPPAEAMHVSCTLCTTHVSCRVSCRVSTGRGGRGAPSRPPARTGLCGPPACDRLQQVHATRDALHRAMNASQTCHLSHSVSLTAKLELHVELVLLLVLLRQTRHHILHHLARGCTRGQTHRVLRAIAAGEGGGRASETGGGASCVRCMRR